ncbi:MAG: O-methyltransferase [Bacteroidales bacterium]
MPQQDYQAIHPDFENYAEAHSTPESDLLYRLYRETNLKTMYPRMMSGQLQGLFLRMVSRMLRPESILEIGTFTGYSTINLAMGLADGGVVHTIDSNVESVEIGKKYFREAGLDDRIVTHIGNAIDIIEKIEGVFDLVFIDADKENYLNYFEMIIDRVRPGGIILADNAFWDGKVFDEKTGDKETQGIIRFNKAIQSDIRVENVLIPLRDGIMMINKR